MWSYDPFVSTRNLLEKSIESLETQLICIQNPHVPIHHYSSKNHTQLGLRKSSPKPFWEDYAFLRNENWFQKSCCNLHLLKNSRRVFFLAADGQTLANSLGWWKTVVFFGKYLQLSTGDGKVSPIKNSSEKMSYTCSKKSTIMSYSPKTKSIFRFQPCKNLGMYNVSRRRRWNLKNESSIFCQNLIRWRGFEATTLCLIEVPFVQGWSVVCCTLDRAVLVFS